MRQVGQVHIVLCKFTLFGLVSDGKNYENGCGAAELLKNYHINWLYFVCEGLHKVEMSSEFRQTPGRKKNLKIPKKVSSDRLMLKTNTTDTFTMLNRLALKPILAKYKHKSGSCACGR